MNSFDKIIGYSAIKKELSEICDMIKNPEVYSQLGATLPHGLLLYGNPGLGKTLMAKCFLEECNLPVFSLHRKKGSEDFIGEITDAFVKAKEQAPTIIFLDDVDKFANEDYGHKDAEEYVAIQSGIDLVKEEKVFVLATANDIYKLPDSLVRAGRFDRKIRIEAPDEQDAVNIIKHYLSKKTVSQDVNMEDMVRMISYESCAGLETVINEAAVIAGMKRKSHIEMEDIIDAVLREVYDSREELTGKTAKEIDLIALHEAGHILVAEICVPGSVGLASIKPKGKNERGGFTYRCKDIQSRLQYICSLLAGKAAVELYYANPNEDGGAKDVERAAEVIHDGIFYRATSGIGMVNPSGRSYSYASDEYKIRSESAASAEMDRLMTVTKDMLLQNREFLEKLRDALVDKEILLYSDVQRIKSTCSIETVRI